MNFVYFFLTFSVVSRVVVCGFKLSRVYISKINRHFKGIVQEEEYTLVKSIDKKSEIYCM